MNADELKLITDAITTLGAQGKEAFVWFLALKYGVAYLMHAILWPAAMYTIYRIAKIINDNSCETYLKAIRHLTHPQ